MFLQYTKNIVNVTKETTDLVQMRELVFDLLKGTALKVILFHQVCKYNCIMYYCKYSVECMKLRFHKL